jgi:hypothetical protein
MMKEPKAGPFIFSLRLEQRAFRRAQPHCSSLVSLTAFMRRRTIPSGCKMR